MAVSRRQSSAVGKEMPPKIIILDMDSSVSPTYGDQEGSAYNGHFGCTEWHPSELFPRALSA